MDDGDGVQGKDNERDSMLIWQVDYNERKKRARGSICKGRGCWSKKKRMWRQMTLGGSTSGQIGFKAFPIIFLAPNPKGPLALSYCWLLAALA